MSVLSLAKFNQTNGDTAIVDGVAGNTWTRVPGSTFAEITTSDNFSGTGSLTTGADGYYNLTLGTPAAFANFTVEAFFKIPTGQTGDITLIEIIGTGGNFRVGMNLATGNLFYAGTSLSTTDIFTDIITESGVVANEQWFHLAIQRNRGEYEILFNGLKSNNRPGGSIADDSIIDLLEVNIGGTPTDVNDNGAVLVDEFRVISEAIYFRNLYSDVETDPGLTYTVNNVFSLSDLSGEDELVFFGGTVLSSISGRFVLEDFVRLQSNETLYQGELVDMSNSGTGSGGGTGGTSTLGGQYWG